MAELKANSLRIRFQRGSSEPTDPQIFEFLKGKLGLKPDKLLAMYKDKPEFSIIVKFKTESDLQSTLRNHPGTMEFPHDKYESSTVQLSAATAVIRYVRLFNLPPEIDDREIWTSMSKFGKVQRTVREKYATDTGFPIWTSVRGIYMELNEGVEIPSSVHIRNIRARVFYEGLINKCFQCGSTEHLKVNCPKRSVNERLVQDRRGESDPKEPGTEETQATKPSYSKIAGSTWSRPPKAPSVALNPSSSSGSSSDVAGSELTNLNALFPNAQKPRRSSAGKSTTVTTEEASPAIDITVATSSNLLSNEIQPTGFDDDIMDYTEANRKRGRHAENEGGEMNSTPESSSDSEFPAPGDGDDTRPSISAAQGALVRNKKKLQRMRNSGDKVGAKTTIDGSQPSVSEKC